MSKEINKRLTGNLRAIYECVKKMEGIVLAMDKKYKESKGDDCHGF